MGFQSEELDGSEFVEVDPTGRYGRYNEILGKGASKIVYKAFDEYEGIEVAWNQVKLNDFLQSPEELERLYCEIHLLKTLKHKNIMKFYSSWVDTSRRNINFVTEMFTSGTLRQYRQKHKRVNIRAVKHWCRQILKGLLYLHSHNPPVIHRDLKCDNIFINGNQGEVKIGDLGLAAILRKSHAAHCVGTPEFMAPEIYEEQYNELVDIYSFGMCILEMVTFEYPYSECTHPAQIYKKVVSGMKPDSLYKVSDPEVRRFVEKCLVTVSRRLPAKELLKDSFLQVDGCSPNSREDESSELRLPRQPLLSPTNSNGQCIGEWYSNGPIFDTENVWEYEDANAEPHGIELFECSEDELVPDVDITIKGRKNDDGAVFLRLRIADKEGRIRNIYFPFDVETDTALSVATEMVAELDIVDYDVTSIAEMIDEEIASLVPDWKQGPGFEEAHGIPTPSVCQNCLNNESSADSLAGYLSSNNPACSNNTVGSHSKGGCSAAMHGRFEEVTYQLDGSEQCEKEGVSALSSQTEELHTYPAALKNGISDHEILRKLYAKARSKSLRRKSFNQSRRSSSFHENCFDTLGVGYQQPPPNLPDDYENEIRQELKWLKTKYEKERQNYQKEQSEGETRPLHTSPSADDLEQRDEAGVESSGFILSSHDTNDELINSLHLGEQVSSRLSHDGTEPTSSAYRILDEGDGLCGLDSGSDSQMTNESNSFTSNNFYSGYLRPGCFPPENSLQVDVVDA